MRACNIFATHETDLDKVWNFSPPDDDFDDVRSASPMSMPDNADFDYNRPLSAALPSAASAPVLQAENDDVTMADSLET